MEEDISRKDAKTQREEIIQESREKIRSYRVMRSVLIAGALFFLDAFVLNQGVLASFICLLMVLVMLINIFRHKEDLKKRMLIMGIYFFAAVLTIGTIRFNSHIAQKHAETIIQACEQFKNQKGMFPARLEDLVPDYLKQIPLAKYAFSYNRFIYSSKNDRHTLMYVAFPPFGKKVYSLGNREWGQID